jgi:MGT family glycosyltransferase
MARILWLNWSGGGNLPPSLGIARELVQRGHHVAFAGRPEMVARVERAGFPAFELTRAYEQADRYPKKWLPKAASYLTSPAVGDQVRALVATAAPDLTIIDAMFPVALTEALNFSCPRVVVSHTAVHRMIEPWRRQIGMMVGFRSESGFEALSADLNDLWMKHDRLIVTTPKALDDETPQLSQAHKIRHVGPVLEREKHGVRLPLPWPDDAAEPLVLVSFSTAPEQGSPAKFQTAVDALATLRVRAVVTVGDSVDPASVKAAASVLVVANADHDDLMRRATMVVTHGGHGTIMRALRHGLPMALIPGLAHDQAPNAAAVERWGAGRALPGDASVEAIREAVGDILGDPAYAERARGVGQHVRDADGAANAAAEIEAALAGAA